MPYKDPDKRKEHDRHRNKLYYQKNKVRINKIKKAYYLRTKTIRKQKRQENYLKNKKSINEYNKRLRRERIDYANSFKIKCNRCPENDPCCLEFHHIDRKSKTEAVSYLANNVFSKEIIKAEIDKCEVLCANCHKKQTRKELDFLKVLGGSQTVSSVQASIVSSF